MKRGYVYVANGEGYVEEAVRSARSLKKVQPDAKVCLLTKNEVSDKVFDIVQKPSFTMCLPIDKVCAIEAPFEEIIYLDTDTYVVSNISDIFELLENFDLALLPALQRGWNYSLPGVPKVFSEFNTGVIAFRNTNKVKSFFHEWKSYHEEVQKDSDFPDRNADQPAFRSVLFHSDLRVAPLPSEYHFRGHLPNYLMWDAKIIHCRGDLENISNIVNKELGARVYIPNFGIYGRYSGKRKVIRQFIQFLIATLRHLVSSPYNSEKDRPNQWHLK